LLLPVLVLPCSAAGPLPLLAVLILLPLGMLLLLLVLILLLLLGMLLLLLVLVLLLLLGSLVAAACSDSAVAAGHVVAAACSGLALGGCSSAFRVWLALRVLSVFLPAGPAERRREQWIRQDRTELPC
jgi:hypothetical protein